MAVRAGADGGVHPGNGSPIGWPRALVNDISTSSCREQPRKDQIHFRPDSVAQWLGYHLPEMRVTFRLD